MDTIGPGDLVALVDDEGARVLLRAEGPPEKVKGVGVLAPGRLVGERWGAAFAHGSKTFRLVRPGYGDLAAGLARKAQIVLPKDASRILYECDVRAGARVVEAGIGSAALTTALARAVGPSGRVFTYELREDFAAWGLENLRRAGLDASVEVRVGNVATDVQERDVDAFVLDVPDPWEAVPMAKRALRPDGYFAAYSPLVSQVEATHRALAAEGFWQVRTLELLERPWVVHERGSRPDHAMLGHTAYLTFARNGV